MPVSEEKKKSGSDSHSVIKPLSKQDGRSQRPVPQPEIRERPRGWRTFWARHIAMMKTRLIALAFSRQLKLLYRSMAGHIYFQTLSAATEFDLFTLLSNRGALTRSEIAQSLSLQEKPVRILLLGLVTMGLLRKRGDYFSNSVLAEKYLTSTSARSLIPIIQWQNHINYRPMQHFAEAIRQNGNVGLGELAGAERTLYERLAHRPELEAIFQRAMQAISVQANSLLTSYVDFSSVKHVVDVGGGNGTNAITLAARYPHLRATVMDSPSVCAIAKTNMEAQPFANRLDVHPGNCFSDSFPRDADAILFCHFFTIWSEEKNLALLKKCFAALPSGGCVIIFNMMQRNDETGPLSASMGSPYFLTLATGEGMLYTWDEYKTWMNEAGFRSIRTVKLPQDHGAIIGIKP